MDSVIFGPGRVADLSRQLDSRGLKRAIVITGASLSRSHLLDRVKAALGGRIAAIFAGASQHVPSKTVSMAAEEARRSGADCII
ncbi:MAG: iron-containing alcohol dehydrogenase, partial [Candidatus Binataceae bacterium]